MRRLSRTAGFAALAATAAMACCERSAVAPTTRFAVADRDAAALQITVDDIRTRVLPTFGTNSIINNFSQSLDALSSALHAGDAAACRAAIARAEDAVGAPSARSGSSAVADAELGVVRLALEEARSTIRSR